MSDHATDGDDGRRRTSRRGFLLAAGTVGVAGAVPATGAARTDAPDHGVAVDGSPTRRGHARAAAARVRRTHGDASVTLDASGTTAALDRFVEGEVDAVAAARPMLPAEAARAAANGIDYADREVPLDTAALRYRSGDWYDPRSPGQIAQRWANGGAAETWAEVAPTERDGAATVGRSARDRSRDRAGERRASPLPDGDSTVLVRGRRAFQHDAGFGGVAYYEPPAERLVAPSEAAGEPDDTDAALVRLRYLYVDRDALGRPAGLAFARAYADGASSERYYRDPHASRTPATTPFEPR